MKNALIVSNSEKSVAFFMEMLNAAGCKTHTVVHSGGEARRLFLESEFDIAIIYMPLKDETGESLSKHIASKDTTQVILVVKAEHFEDISAVTEDAGVLVVQRPVDRNVFWSSLKLAKAAQKRLKKYRDENKKLTQRIEDIRIIDRAKCILISHLKMSEQDAHRFIEKQAMDMRTNKRAVAESVLSTYEN